MENTPIKIRTLKKRDQETISRMLGRAAQAADGKMIREVISSAQATASDGTELDTADRSSQIIVTFLELFKKVMVNFGDDVTAFFADLAGMTVEQYKDMPIDIDVRVLEALKEAPEVENFFTGVSRLYKTTRLFQDIRKSLAAKLGSIVESIKAD